MEKYQWGGVLIFLTFLAFFSFHRDLSFYDDKRSQAEVNDRIRALEEKVGTMPAAESVTGVETVNAIKSLTTAESQADCVASQIAAEEKKWATNPRQIKSPTGILLLLCFHTPVYKGYIEHFKNSRGKPHHKLIHNLISTIRSTSPGLPIAVATDDEKKIREMNTDVDYVVKLNLTGQTEPWQEKLFAVSLTPFLRTIYLDSDVVACTDLNAVFQELDDQRPRVDMAATRLKEGINIPPGGYRAGNSTLKRKITRFEATHGFYSSFMYYRLGPQTNRYFYDTLQLSLEKKIAGDQWALNIALRTLNTYNKPMTFHYLSDEYLHQNRVNEMPFVVARPIVIVHGINATCDVNKKIQPRLIHGGRIVQLL